MRLWLITSLFLLVSCSSLISRGPSSDGAPNKNITSDSCTKRTINSIEYYKKHRYLFHEKSIAEYNALAIQSGPIKASKIKRVDYTLSEKFMYLKTKELPDDLAGIQNDFSLSYVIIDGETYVKAKLYRFIDENEFKVELAGKMELDKLNAKNLKDAYLAGGDQEVPGSHAVIPHSKIDFHEDEDGDKVSVFLYSKANLFNPNKEQGEAFEIASIDDNEFNSLTGELTIGLAEVMPGMKRNDLSSLLLKKLLDRVGNVTTIQTELIDTNRTVFRSSLIESLHKGGLITKAHTDSFNFEDMELGKVSSIFRKCCSQMDKSSLESFIIDALKQTPAYKIRKKFGFTRICNYKFDNDNYLFNISFGVCRGN